MSNLDIYNKLKQPPKEALRTIQAGRLSGKTDINPQWRYKAMTEQFGPCGVGWKYEILRLWNEPANDGQVFCFAEINLYFLSDTNVGNIWSDPIPGVGGSMLVIKEHSGLHASDEGYKMAITDALSVAMKMIGVAGDIYAGLWDGTKYSGESLTKTEPEPSPEATKSESSPAKEKGSAKGSINKQQTEYLLKLKLDKGYPTELLKAIALREFKKDTFKNLSTTEANSLIEIMEQGKYLNKEEQTELEV